MKLSIMLTSYNLVDYIDSSIESVVRMEMPCDWELLIGDDGSTDGTVEKIEKWIEKYPKNIRLFKVESRTDNQMLGSKAAHNRARLLEKATGDFLNYLDGDDCFLGTEKFKRQIEILSNPKYAHCSCCGHNSVVYRMAEGRHTILTDEKKNRNFTFKQYWPYYYVHTNCILFRKECKDLMLGVLNRNYLNDNFITFLMLQNGDMYFINENWAQYNMTGTGLWTGHSKLYGHVRNLQIFDLQLHVNPKASSQILMRQHPDVLYVARNMAPEYREEISPLLKGLEPEVFVNTLLLTKDNLDSKESSARNRIIKIANYKHILFRTRRAYKKVLRMLKIAG